MQDRCAPLRSWRRIRGVDAPRSKIVISMQAQCGGQCRNRLASDPHAWAPLENRLSIVARAIEPTGRHTAPGTSALKPRRGNGPHRVPGSKGLFLLSVLLRGCHGLQGEVQPEEPVYRVRRSRLGFPVWTSVCAGCLSLATD